MSVSITPFADFVKKVGGSKVDVTVLIPPGVDPHDFEPSFQHLRSIADADIYFRVGEVFHLENSWLQNIKLNNEQLQIEDCSKGIEIINNNPHYWLGLDEVKTAANNIFVELVRLQPDSKEYFKKNLDSFIYKIDSANGVLQNEFEKIKNKKLLVYHPAWNYFVKNFGIEEISIERNGKEPKAADLRNVIDYAKAEKIKAIFVEPQFESTSAKAIADEVGAVVETINPLPKDFLLNLDDLKTKLSTYLN